MCAAEDILILSTNIWSMSESMLERRRDETMRYAEFRVLRQAYVGRCHWLRRVPSATEDHQRWRGEFQT